MQNDVIFADGVRVRETQYSTKVTVFVEDFKKLVREHSTEWKDRETGEVKKVLNLEIKKSQAGNLYCKVDTWKPDPNYKPKNQPANDMPDDWE